MKWGDTGAWSNQRAYAFHTNPGLKLNFAISDDAHQNDGSFHAFETPSGVLSLNAWNHVAAVYDQTTGTRRTYVNGIEVAQRTDPPITLTRSIADVGIGAWVRAPSTFAFPFSGMIDEVEFFNRALSAGEIQSIFNAGSAGKCKDGIRIIEQTDTTTGNITVNPGEILTIKGATVTGNVSVNGGTLNILDGVTINGSVHTSGNNPNKVINIIKEKQLREIHIDELNVDNCLAFRVYGPGHTHWGNATIRKSITIDMTGTQITGRLTVQDCQSVRQAKVVISTPNGRSNPFPFVVNREVHIDETTLNGSLIGTGNGQISVTNCTINGDLILKNNGSCFQSGNTVTGTNTGCG